MQNLNTTALLTGAKFYKGVNAIKKNLAEIKPIYESIKTSFGPLGLDKMCISTAGDVFITNDGATIVQNMLVDSAIGKILTNLAIEQDKEVGDGTTTVVLLAYNLIEKGYELITEYNVHPSIVVNGYRMAFNESVRVIKESLAVSTNNINKYLESIIRTTISSKIINEESELFLEIIQKAVKYNLKNITLLKSVGGSMKDSEFYEGFILNCSIASDLMRKRIEKCKILLLDFGLLKEKMPLTVNISAGPKELEKVREKEIELTKEKCKAIIDSNVDLVLTTGGIDEICIKMFIDNGITAVRRVDRADLTVLSNSLNCPIYHSMFNLENEIDLSPVEISYFEVREYGEYKLVHLNAADLNTILIKGPTTQICDEIQRSINDAIEVIRKTFSQKSILPGGGATEIALSIALESFSSSILLKEHVAIHRYAESLKEIVKILCFNGSIDGNKRVANMLHKNKGIDILTDSIQDNISMGIVEPTAYKLKALRAATEAAISIIRINEVIEFTTEENK
ncbi:hypothetical protein NUSPORA_01746 [Nucleospora cyclopteri]